MEDFEKFTRRKMLQLRLWIRKKSGKTTEVNDDVEDRELASFRQQYLLFHHVGYYFWMLAHTMWSDSFLAEYPVLFYYVLFMVTLSLEVYSWACGPPGFVTEEPPNPDGLYFCTICQHHCPVRAMHCRTCNRCVHRRDHHCPWTGTCVGRDNHAMFVLFLLCEVMLMVPVNVVIYMGMFEPKPPLQWLHDNAGTLVIAFLCSFDVALVASLLRGHLWLMWYNSTTWEVRRRDRITYMREYPHGLSPFDRGPWENIKEFVTMAYTKKVYEPPPPPDLSKMFAERRVISEVTGLDDEQIHPPIYQQMIGSLRMG